MRAMAILAKELRDSVRDRKTVLSGLMFGLMGPVAIFYIVAVMASFQHTDVTARVSFCRPVEAPSLVAHLVDAGIEIVGDAPVCLDIPGDFESRLARGETARVGVLADLTHPDPAVAALEGELRVFSGESAAQRLLARGLAPSVVSVLQVDLQSTNPVSRGARAFGAVVVIFLVLTPFVVGAGMAADLTAGERERRSLEPLLATPAQPADIVLGKFLAVSVFNLVGTALCIAFGLAILDHSALPELGVRLDARILTILRVVAWLAPLNLFVAAAEIVVGFYSKNFKDAQNMLMMLMLVPMGIGYASISLGRAGPWPVLWETAALAGPLFGSTAPVASFLVTTGVELALAGALLLLAVRRLKSPLVFRRA